MQNDGISGYPVKVGTIFKVFTPAKSGQNVIAVKVNCKCIQRGDEICFGDPAANEAVKQTIVSLGVDGHNVPKVNQGINCGIQVDGKVPATKTEVWIIKPTDTPVEDTNAGKYPVQRPYQND